MASSAEPSSTQKDTPIRIGIVVGESSGDILGAGLVSELQRLYPQAIFEGIGGPRMLALGFNSLFPQDRLAVMGLVEPLKRLPELLRIRKQLRQHFIQNPPNVFIGIDSPDFNLDLELALRAHGIKTAHYVSPTVWAWRQGRIKKIARAVDLMLTLFPFEQQFYEDHNVPVKCVGHPLADTIPLHGDKQAARTALRLESLTEGKKMIALLPGSRATEVERLGPVFVEMARLCCTQRDDLVFVMPSASERRHEQIEQLLAAQPDKLPIQLVAGQSHQVMAAADVVLMASGTTTLEAMLLKRPMVITYKSAPLSYWLFSKLVKVDYIGLPNLLAQKELVREFIQDQAQPELLLDAVLKYIDNPELVTALEQEFDQQHRLLRKNASREAAKAISSLVMQGEPECA